MCESLHGESAGVTTECYSKENEFGNENRVIPSTRTQWLV